MSITRTFALPVAAALVLAAGIAGAQSQGTNTGTQAPTGSGSSSSAEQNPSGSASPTASMARDDGAPAGQAADMGIVISGTVVSARNGSLVLSTDDHHHRITFDVGSAAGASDLRRGQRVSVRYHATGATGQAVDEVTVLGQGQAPVNQASFRPVVGSDADVRRASSMDDSVNARGQGVHAGQPADRDASDRAAGPGGTLPATASGLPAMAASGLALLLAGVALTRRRRAA